MTILRTLLAVLLAGTVLPAAAQTADGGCQATLGELPAADAQRLEALSALGDRSRELEMLAGLHAFLVEDPSRRAAARPLIQAILAKAIRFGEIAPTSGDASDLDAARRLVKLYTDDDGLYPEYSYEASLCRELQFVLVTTGQLQELRSGDPETRLERVEPLARKYNPLKVAAAKLGLADLWQRPVDACARARLWGYAWRLVGGHLYYLTGQGIENDEPTAAKLIEAYRDETDAAVREVAGPVYEALAARR